MPIRTMAKNDIADAVGLIQREGWGHTRVDLDRMLSLSPRGSLVWESSGELCGFVTSMRYQRTAMIGHLLVSSGSRGRQIGKSLVHALIEDSDSSGIDSSMLYATVDGSRLYRQFGFVDSGLELVAIGIRVKDEERLSLRRTCEDVRPEDLEEIASHDRDTFGDDRSELIARLYGEFPEHCFKVEESGRVAGCIFGRRTPIGYDIGPWFCSSGRREDAAALLDTVIRSFPCGGRIDISPFVSNSNVPEVIARYHRYRKAERVKLMIRGERRYDADISSVLGVVGFELG